MICLAALTASCFIACGDGGTEAARADIRDGDLVLLDLSANAWTPDQFGFPSFDHNYSLDVDCPARADSLDDRGDSGTVAFAEFNRGKGGFSVWFVGRNTCREAGALLAAARADLAGYGFADSTPDFTKLRYRLRGQGLDSIRVPIDAVRDSAAYPRLSALVSALERAMEIGP
jgi:hypothetical protein